MSTSRKSRPKFPQLLLRSSQRLGFRCEAGHRGEVRGSGAPVRVQSSARLPSLATSRGSGQGLLGFAGRYLDRIYRIYRIEDFWAPKPAEPACPLDWEYHELSTGPGSRVGF
jgi:hypothetical protein